MMYTGCIYNIDLTANNNDIISVSSDEFNHFYIANLDADGDEISYEKRDSNTLYANFFMIKVLFNDDVNNKIIIDRLLKNKDLIKVTVHFTNGTKQEFNIAKKRITQNGILENIYEEAYLDNDDLCILITDKKIKYKRQLFA